MKTNHILIALVLFAAPLRAGYCFEPATVIRVWSYAKSIQILEV